MQTYELSADWKRRLRQLRDRSAGFDAWDRFDHAKAWQLLSLHMNIPQIQPLGLFLKRVMHSRAAIDDNFDAPNGIAGHGYEIVEDLLFNAERRASQERHDDAVGRLYRALELLAQIRWWLAYGIKTGNVDRERLPEALRDRVPQQDGKIQLALQKSYQLLSCLSEDPLGALYLQHANALTDVLQIRNYSLLAHGFRPVTKSDYCTVNSTIGDFIRTGIEAVIGKKLLPPADQFPKNLAS